ncbi:dimethylsulfonioproprionate lyase family protein [Rhizobium sp. AU243]|uniref:dimethylsulfonioproprionate lyase family protein n=1 Tax=Rhizobium sp. AU243 TaxID=2303425 RepID=UPI0014852717|nr:dimethylsulfonioproprionate lyase family protein [Rhizobium sp. AU243]
MVNVEVLISDPVRKSRKIRNERLQHVVDALGNVLFSQTTPTMARFEGAKVVDLLQARSRLKTKNTGSGSCPIQAVFAAALNDATEMAPSNRVPASTLGALTDKLTWLRAEGGPYASLNFGRNHAQAALVGPGGIEERSDLMIGLIAMTPYTRVPDHRQNQPQVCIHLTEGEFLSADGEWRCAVDGTPFYHQADSDFTMRSTSRPLIMLWLQRLSG